jgi:hypothetical protein
LWAITWDAIRKWQIPLTILQSALVAC